MPLSLFTTFNFLVPKDRLSRRVGHDIAYGVESRQQLDVYAPRRGEGPWPVVFFIYGGSWMDGDRGNYEFAGRAIAALGYVVVVADYRLVPEIEYPGFLDDCTTAFSWMEANIERYGGDTRRVALMGHSAGAYNAEMLALAPTYRARAPGLGQLRCVVALSGPADFYPFDGLISMRTFGAVRDPALTQPIRHVSPAAPPMLLATGDRDELVYPRNSVALAERLEADGVEAKVIHYPTLGHAQTLLALSRIGRGWAPVYRDVAAYLALKLG